MLTKLSAAAALLIAALALTGCHSQHYDSADWPIAKLPSKPVVVFHSFSDQKGEIYGDFGLAHTRYIPCSTFKITSTLMGLEYGVVADRNTRLGYDGRNYEITAWNSDVTLEEAFRASCVWYYKKLIAGLDKETMQHTLDHLQYGNRDISAWNSNGHNVFWIESSLQISPVEQIAVLEKIFEGNSDFQPAHIALVKDFMRYENIGDIRFYGKTGTGRNYNTNRLESWFVGFCEPPGQERVYFAAHGADPDRDVLSSEIRDLVRTIIAERK